MKAKDKLGFTQWINWREQTLKEAQEGYAATGSLTPENDSAFTAGYREGYRQAILALTCHGFIDVDTNH